MKNEIIELFETISSKLGTYYSDEEIVEDFQKNLSELVERYKELDLKPVHKPTSDVLIQVGKELILKDQIGKLPKLLHFIRLGYSCIVDFTEMQRPLKPMIRAYVVACALLLVLGLMIHPIIPVLFAAPAYFGYGGLCRRDLRTTILGGAVMPVSMFVGMFIFGMAVNLVQMHKYGEMVATLSGIYHMAEPTMNIIIIVSSILGAIMMSASLFCLYYLLRFRKMFV